MLDCSYQAIGRRLVHCASAWWPHIEGAVGMETALVAGITRSIKIIDLGSIFTLRKYFYYNKVLKYYNNYVPTTIKFCYVLVKAPLLHHYISQGKI